MSNINRCSQSLVHALQMFAVTFHQAFGTRLQVPRTPRRQEQPKKEKSGFVILCGALLHLVVLLSAAWGSWTSQHSMPMMPLYHQHISQEFDATGLPLPSCNVRHVPVIGNAVASTPCKHAKYQRKLLCCAMLCCVMTSHMCMSYILYMCHVTLCCFEADVFA